jgi:glycine cleavage system regulatory protein
MATLVLTVIGADRTGLVNALAGTVAAHGGNWDRSHLARLAGQFAGIVVVTVDDGRVDELRAALEGIHAQGLLDVRVAIASTDAAAEAAGTGGDSSTLQLHLVGQDRPGIVSEVAGALARRNVSIEELATSRTSAPMSGEPLFEATATLRVPATAEVAQLRAALEEIANELMVDLDVSTSGDGPAGSTAEGG